MASTASAARAAHFARTLLLLDFLLHWRIFESEESRILLVVEPDTCTRRKQPHTVVSMERAVK